MEELGLDKDEFQRELAEVHLRQQMRNEQRAGYYLNSGLKVHPLTEAQRSKIRLQMSQEQLDILEKYTMYQMRSQFHNQRYLENTDWAFSGLHIDYGYQRSDWRGRRSQALYCGCGRRLKYQFEIKSKSTGRKKFLGSTHFCEELHIPQSVANEIKKGISWIDLYADEILVAYQAGERFPIKKYQLALKLSAFPEEAKKFKARCADYAAVNLPLFHNDLARLNSILEAKRSALFSEELRTTKIVNQVRANQTEPVQLKELQQVRYGAEQKPIRSQGRQTEMLQRDNQQTTRPKYGLVKGPIKLIDKLLGSEVEQYDGFKNLVKEQNQANIEIKSLFSLVVLKKSQKQQFANSYVAPLNLLQATDIERTGLGYLHAELIYSKNQAQQLMEKLRQRNVKREGLTIDEQQVIHATSERIVFKERRPIVPRHSATVKATVTPRIKSKPNVKSAKRKNQKTIAKTKNKARTKGMMQTETKPQTAKAVKSLPFAKTEAYMKLYVRRLQHPQYGMDSKLLYRAVNLENLFLTTLGECSTYEVEQVVPKAFQQTMQLLDSVFEAIESKNTVQTDQDLKRLNWLIKDFRVQIKNSRMA